MTSLDPTAVAPAGVQRHDPLALRLAPALYAATLFASALLLFAIQPMFTKMVLPRLGGSPSVWSVAMVFFQAALLAGYAYAHGLMRVLPAAYAALVHLAVLACAALTLPLAIATGFGDPPADGISLWLFGLFAASIGLPFVALAASAPLLQSWFALTGHPRAANPYVLYAASNLGSFAALLAYPLAIEPLLSLQTQAQLWSAGFAVLAALMATAALALTRTNAAAAPVRNVPRSEAPSWGRRIGWVGLAAVPSGLVVAVTAHLTTDIAAAPFLWVIPLALYLLTFVMVFRERPWLSQAQVGRIMPFAIALLALSAAAAEAFSWLAMIALHLMGFMVLTLACHGELYARRPAADRLTGFYLWMSLGGVLGGAFAGLLAPALFNNTYEYPILLALSVLAAPGIGAMGGRAFLRQSWPYLAVAGALVALWAATPLRLPPWSELSFQAAMLLLVGWMLARRQHAAVLFGLVVLCFVLAQLWRPGIERVETMRSFFGVHKVAELAEGKVRLLFHGTTIHGAERLKTDDGHPVDGAPEPLTYYYVGGPIGEGIAAARASGSNFRRVAVVGLGAGSLACHRRAGEDWTFFEIDPEVVRLARDPQRFRFLTRCAPDAPVVLGDARLTLAASEGQYDLIVLDAFSSDSIPVHLLTREAFAGYLRRLSPHGIIVVHISNRHMELAPVLAAVGAAEGLLTWTKEDDRAGDFLATFRANARVAMLTRDRGEGDQLSLGQGWKRIVGVPSQAWTDDFSNILGAIWAKKAAPRGSR